MAYRATHKYARISPRKVRPLADMIRGKLADEALDILRFQPQRGARMLEKVLKSAIGNARDPDNPQNKGRMIEPDRLYVSAANRRRWTDVQTHSTSCSWNGVCHTQADVTHQPNVGRDIVAAICRRDTIWDKK